MVNRLRVNLDNSRLRPHTRVIGIGTALHSASRFLATTSFREMVMVSPMDFRPPRAKWRPHPCGDGHNSGLRYRRRLQCA